MLLDRTTGQLRFVASLRPAAARKAARYSSPSKAVAGAVLLENREIVLDDVSTDPRHFRLADQQSSFVTRSLIGVPMRYRDG